STPRRFRDPGVRPHREVHADEPGRPGERPADDEPNRRVQVPQDDEQNGQDDRNPRDDRVLPREVRLRALLDRARVLLHPLVAGCTNTGLNGPMADPCCLKTPSSSLADRRGDRLSTLTTLSSSRSWTRTLRSCSSSCSRISSCVGWRASSPPGCC